MFKEEEPSENIYEDIGKTKIQEVQKRGTFNMDGLCYYLNSFGSLNQGGLQ